MSSKTKMSFREQIEGFPVSQIAIAGIVRIVEPIAFTSLFPYVYFMVRDFHIAKNEEDVAKYVGYLASCFSFCQFLSSVQWGMVADKIGRKKVIMIGLTGSTIGMLIFGFAKNYWIALAARSMMGLLNGNTAVLRTLIGEKCTEKKHQALALSTMPLLFQLGSIVGPVIGGMLTHKSDNDYETSLMSSMFFPHAEGDHYNVRESVYYRILAPVAQQTEFTNMSFQKFTDKYPYGLSNVVLAVAFTISILSCFFFLEETHYKIKYKRDIGIDIMDEFLKMFGVKRPQRPWNSHRQKASEEEEPLLGDNDDISSYSAATTDNTKDATEPRMTTILRKYKSRDTIISKDEEESNWRVLFSRKILTVIITSVSMNAHNTVYSEFFPVFLAKRTGRVGKSSDFCSPLTSKFPFKIIGGMGFDSVNVGKILAGTGISGFFIIAVVFPWIDRTFKSHRAFQAMSFLYCIIYMTLPYLIFLLPPNVPSLVHTKIILYVFTFFRVVAIGTTVPLIVLLLHRASPAKKRAFINGASLSSSALMRFIAPMVMGNVMSWSESIERGWIPWWTLFFIAFLSFLQSFRLSDADEEEEEEEDPATALEVAEEEEEFLES